MCAEIFKFHSKWLIDHTDFSETRMNRLRRFEHNIMILRGSVISRMERFFWGNIFTHRTRIKNKICDKRVSLHFCQMSSWLLTSHVIYYQLTGILFWISIFSICVCICIVRLHLTIVAQSIPLNFLKAVSGYLTPRCKEP